MNINDIQPAIKKITEKKVVMELRAHTYLTTYPEILSFGQSPVPIDARRFKRIVSMTYGWMPRILRIDPKYTNDAVSALIDAQSSDEQNANSVKIGSIKKCLHSMVGASKVLHFVNPNVFPIIDSKIQSKFGPWDGQITSIKNYLSYMKAIYSIKSDPKFNSFYKDFCLAYVDLLKRSGIEQYRITEIRAIEAAAYEMSQS